MKYHPFYKILFIFLLIQLNNEAFAKSGPLVLSSGKLEIRLQDHLHHPYYWWPSTLLNYPVLFDEKPLAEQFTLTDQAKGIPVPFQISGIKEKGNGQFIAILSFITDLPSGGKNTFTLERSSSNVNFPRVKVMDGKEYITIQTDKLAVRLPASQGSSAVCPGPVIGISDIQGKWIGSSILETSGKKLISITTQPISVGPLFADYQIKYSFEGGAVYDVVVKCITGYDFFEIKEEMTGFSEATPVFWEINWNGFSPTHRQAPNHPYFPRRGYNTQTDIPGIGRFKWETIDQSIMGSHGGISYAGQDGKMPFYLDTYGSYGPPVTSSLFWDDNSMQSVGIFMNDASYWNDQLYPIWNISGMLSVGFYYRDKQLLWKYPLINGTRSTAISCYNHSKDIAFMDELEKLFQPQQHPLGFNYRARMSPLSHNHFLQSRYGTIHLDRIKDWVLTYPDSLPVHPFVFPKSSIKTVKDFEREFLFSSYINELPVSGPCQNGGYGPANNRVFYRSWVQAMNYLLPGMSKQEKERFISMFLFHCYIAAGEEFMPMRNMLSGNPNFLSDVKTTPVWAAFLFPEHPEAKNWEELFGKYVELNTHYHTRPDVKTWNAEGGRWTENLGTYVWAFLRPSLNANSLIQNYGSGRNFLAGKSQAMIGSWLLHSLSAPYDGESLEFYRSETGNIHPHHWGIVTKENGPKRVHPPQGAHSARRMPPAELWLLGQMLKNYDPLLSENISYVTNPDHDYAETHNDFSIFYPKNKVDIGTPPDFQSVKFTGYGTILRAGVGTEEELSIHLSQIDKGTNYRWGMAADGGTGTIYFYAGGKSYSHNGKEDAGDRRVQDTDLITNFGVMKDGMFKSIGQNVLSKPLYDLEIGQFTEIVSSKEDPYSWPEYQGRSIMLVGTDYFIVYDDVYFDNIISRFSWFTHPDEDFPDIQVIKSGAAGYRYFVGKPTKTEIFGPESKGVWYDGSGDFLVFVSHKEGFRTEIKDYGADVETPAGGKDFIFRNDTPVIVDEPGMTFSGIAGFIRQRENGVNELSIFNGTKIGDEKFEIEKLNSHAGISAILENQERISGRYYSEENSEVTFRWRKAKPANINFYLNGVKHPIKDSKDEIKVNIPAGNYIWNIGSLPDLTRPGIQYTKNDKGKVLIAINPVAGATHYHYEYSTNAGKKWDLLKEQSDNSLWIKPRASETKGFVRVIALNEEHSSKPSVIYPVYFTREKPLYPEGLKINILNSNEVELSWGRVLGCNQYRLYRRTRESNEKYRLVYQGEGNQFKDNKIQENAIYEYAVASVNANGEGKLCYPVTNDPDSWLNFDPMPGEPFRRTRIPLQEYIQNSASYYPE